YCRLIARIDAPPGSALGWSLQRGLADYAFEVRMQRPLVRCCTKCQTCSAEGIRTRMRVESVYSPPGDRGPAIPCDHASRHELSQSSLPLKELPGAGRGGAALGLRSCVAPSKAASEQCGPGCASDFRPDTGRACSF